MIRVCLVCCLALLSVAGCATDSCPAGSEKVGERCVAVDAGAPSDAHLDALTDALADTSMPADARIDMTTPVICTPTCAGDTPFCVDGTCRECNEDSDCPDHSPLCLVHSCEPCSAGDCSPEQEFAEIAARGCLQFTRFLQASSFESFVAAMCAGTEITETRFYRTAIDALQDGRARFDAAGYEACTSQPLDLARSCTDLVGTTPDGASCYDNRECISRRCNTTSSCPGTCATGVPEHATCTFSTVCNVGLSCLGGTCERGGHIGEACVEGECADGECRGGICGDDDVIGDECFSPGNFCSPTLFCSVESSTCRTFHGNGESCDMAYLGPRCAEGYECDSGTCRPAIAEGDECTSSTADRCLSGTRCTAGHCERVRVNNERCGPAPCASGLRCVSGRCEALPTLGEACIDAEGCLRGVCRSGTCASLEVGDSCLLAQIGEAGDALDTCGLASTCISDGVSAPECTEDATTGESCGQSVAQCADPSQSCSASHCTAACLP